MADKADIYSGGRKVGEVRVVPDYEGAAAAGIVGCLLQIVVYDL